MQNNTYITFQTSQFFANLAIAEISQFLRSQRKTRRLIYPRMGTAGSLWQQAETIDYLELVKTFRHWVRSQLKERGTRNAHQEMRTNQENFCPLPSALV